MNKAVINILKILIYYRTGKYNKHSFNVFYDLRVMLSEKAMATHSSTLAWKIPWTEEPGRLQSMGSQRVGHD